MTDLQIPNKPDSATGGFIGRLARAIVSLLKGMKVTWHYLVRPSTVVTQQYPENRESLTMFDRYRAQLTMLHDENGFHKCTACQFCEQACPNGSIKVLFRDKPVTGKPELDALIWRLDSCTFCNACVVVCPFSILKFQPKFEQAVYDRRTMIYNLSRYAGPTSMVLNKITDPAERAKMVEPRPVFYGPIPLCGHELPGVSALKPTEPKNEDPSKDKGKT